MIDTRCQVFRVLTINLPKATAAMNYRGRERFFASRVVQVIPQGRMSLLVVETEGSYPFIEAQWEQFIVKDAE